MALTLYYHPLASFCHKVLIALYENQTPFIAQSVDLMNRDASAAFLELWPVGKMPVLRDDRADRTVPETTIIIEYIAGAYPGACALFPAGEAECLDARLWDRFFDLYIQVPMQKMVTDRLRADAEHDVRGVADAKATLHTAYDMLERHMENRLWAAGSSFSVADCAAAPALFFADIMAPFSASHPHLAAYFERLLQRASFQRVLAEARPYFHMFPFKEAIPARFLS